MNRDFSKEDVEMAHKHMRRCSSLVTRELQIKTTVRYPFTPTRKALIKKHGKISVGEDLEKLGPTSLLMGLWNSTATLGKCLAVPQNVQEITVWSSNFTPRSILGKMKLTSRPRQNVRTSILMTQNWKQSRVQLMKGYTEWSICPYNETAFGHKKERSTDICYGIYEPLCYMKETGHKRPHVIGFHI